MRPPHRSWLVAPLLLAPLLLTACAPASSAATASAAGTSTRASTSTGASTSTAAPAAASVRIATSAQLCALVPLAAAQAAAKPDPAFTTAKAVPGQVQCMYDADHGSIAGVAYGPAGSGLVDLGEQIDSKHNAPTAVQVGGRSGKAIDQVVQVDVGDESISVFTVGHELSRAQLSALAAAFVAKLS